MEKTIKKIISYFEENESIFNECIEELDGWNGYLGDDRYYEMEMLKEFYHGVDPIEVLNRAYFGHDADSWHTDSLGERMYGGFDPNRNYFKFNGYGNLISTNYPEYTSHLGKWFVESYIENISEMEAYKQSEDLEALFEELEAIKDEND